MVLIFEFLVLLGCYAEDIDKASNYQSAQLIIGSVSGYIQYDLGRKKQRFRY